MKRYDKTLKEYLKLHSRHRLSSQQRMHIILQMLKSMRESHQIGIAHRDLSSVNYMIDSKGMDDLPELYLIDFGKAVFYDAEVAKKWWVDSDDGHELYEDDVKPNSREELAIWCKNLPYCMARPDHGYRFYRSIQTLPRTNRDHELLPYLIDPAAEDIYSLGNIVWKTFLDIEPWPGIFDTDLKLLRETVGKDANIDAILEKSMPGPMSIQFLKMFLRAKAEDRKSADEILRWIESPGVQEELMQEWSG
ncbi:kinase-like domain-containing protein, partial [Pilaira anomala]